MSVNSNRKRPIGRFLVSIHLTSGLMREKAFTLVELLVVMLSACYSAGKTSLDWNSYTPMDVIKKRIEEQ